MECRAQYDQGRCEIADRRSVGNIAADGTRSAYLLRGKAPHQGFEVWVNLGEIGQGFGMRHASAEEDRVFGIQDLA